MAKKEINVVIAAKNAMAKGLGEAKASLEKFGESAKRIAGFFVKGFLAAGTAVAGFVAKSLSAYAEQEKAERSLIAAMNAHGEAGEALLPMLRRKADAIQRETGIADEATLAGMARMRMLGVQIDQLDRAAQGVIALTRAGMGQEAAERAMAAAMDGNYEMLTRYIPALRSATDEAEKQQIVNEFLTRGYAAQQEELNTVAGRWGALKGAVGDMWEEFGRAISQNDLVVQALARAQAAVERFRDVVVDWVDGGGVQNLIAGFQLFFAEVRHIFNMVSNSAHVAFSAISDGAESVFRYVQGIATAWFDVVTGLFRGLGEIGAAAFQAIRRPGRESFAALRQSVSDFTSSAAENVTRFVDATVNGYEVITRRTDEALQQRERYHEEHSDRIEEISAKQRDALMEHEEQRLKAAKEAAEAEAKLAEGVRDSIVERARETTSARLKEIRTRLRAEHEAGNDVSEIAKKMSIESQKWARDLTASLMAEIEERVENEEEAAELKRKIQEQLSADIDEIQTGLTELVRVQQMKRVENEEEATDLMVEAHREAAKEINKVHTDAISDFTRGGLGSKGGRMAGTAFGAAWNQSWNAEVNRFRDQLGFGGFDAGSFGRGLNNVHDELVKIREQNHQLLTFG